MRSELRAGAGSEGAFVVHLDEGVDDAALKLFARSCRNHAFGLLRRHRLALRSSSQSQIHVGHCKNVSLDRYVDRPGALLLADLLGYDDRNYTTQVSTPRVLARILLPVLPEAGGDLVARYVRRLVELVAA